MGHPPRCCSSRSQQRGRQVDGAIAFTEKSKAAPARQTPPRQAGAALRYRGTDTASRHPVAQQAPFSPIKHAYTPSPSLLPPVQPHHTPWPSLLPPVQPQHTHTPCPSLLPPVQPYHTHPALPCCHLFSPTTHTLPCTGVCHPFSPPLSPFPWGAGHRSPAPALRGACVCPCMRTSQPPPPPARATHKAHTGASSSIPHTHHAWAHAHTLLGRTHTHRIQPRMRAHTYPGAYRRQPDFQPHLTLQVQVRHQHGHLQVERRGYRSTLCAWLAKAA